MTMVAVENKEETLKAALKCVKRAKIHGLKHCQYPLSEGDSEKEVVALLSGLGYMAGVRNRIIKIHWKE